MWNTKTLKGMEETAEQEGDRDCSKKIGNFWLRVIATDNGFEYEWGKNKISRRQAEEIFKQV